MAKKSNIQEIIKKSNVRKKTNESKKTKTEVKEKRIRKKKIKQNFTEDSTTYEAQKVIFRIKDGDKFKNIKKVYPMPIRFNKRPKIGYKTKVATGDWCKIVDVITDEKDLVFVLEPITEQQEGVSDINEY